jgi:hypothetical protein
MNIFVTDKDALSCAIMLDNKRLNKMIVESAQLLSTTANTHGCSTTYKPTHRNHPCTLWAGKTRSNYLWLLGLLQEMYKEYTYRFDKVHACSRLIDELIGHSYSIGSEGDQLTEWANCSMFKDSKSVEMAYRATMAIKWTTLDKNPTWTKRGQPDWYEELAAMILV